MTDRRARGGPVVDLTGSNPTRVGLPYDEAAILDALGDPRALTYAPDPRGALVAREALVAAGLAPGVDRVLLTASTSEAYAHLFTLLCDPGDEVLVPMPSYPLLAHLAHLSSITLSPYPTRHDGRWRAEPTDLFDAVSERTRAIVVVSPNHPTGAYADRDDLEAFAALGLPLIVDEVFHAYPLEAPADRPRAFALEGTESLVFSLDGASKRLALPQLKLGWISVGGPEAAAMAALERLELIADTYLSPSTTQLALPALLSCSTAPDAIRARTATNLAALRAACVDTAATVPKVEGGWFAPVRLPATRTDEAWALALVEEGVLVHPGYFYDFPDDEAWIAVSLLTPEPDFARGVDQIARLAR
ncbi:MAG: pyridoxal phosphate-dependent aminotransferase [Sandaracinaceae bacterium]